MLEGIRMMILLLSLFICAWVDWKKEKVCMPFLFMTGIAAVLFHLFLQDSSVYELLSGTLVGAAMLLYALCTKESIGYGDGCLFVITGLFLGFRKNLLLLLLAAVMTGITGAFLMVMRKKGRKDRIPFIPFVLASFVLLLV